MSSFEDNSFDHEFIFSSDIYTLRRAMEGHCIDYSDLSSTQYCAALINHIFSGSCFDNVAEGLSTDCS